MANEPRGKGAFQGGKFRRQFRKRPVGGLPRLRTLVWKQQCRGATKGHLDEFVEDGFRMGSEGKEGAFLGNATDRSSWMKSNLAHPANAPWCPVQVTVLDGKTI